MKALFFLALAVVVPECCEVETAECRCAPGDACVAGACLTRWVADGFEHLLTQEGETTRCGVKVVGEPAGDDSDAPHCPACWGGR